MLTPIDVQQKKFTTALRGYDLDEVDDFLDDVVTTIRDYDQRLRDAEERVSVLESELSANRETGDAISRAFVVAQRSADGIVVEARSEAERIVGEARATAAQLSAAQVAEKQALEAELDRMRSSVQEIRERINRLAQSTEGEFRVAESAIEEVAPEPGSPASGIDLGGDEAEGAESYEQAEEAAGDEDESGREDLAEHAPRHRSRPWERG